MGMSGAAPVVALSATAGIPFDLTVTLFDAYGNVATGYAGTVHFTSSDASAQLPAGYLFTPADKGIHVFKVLLKTKGQQTITASDNLNSSLTGAWVVTVL